ncbi:hypothetical protein ACFY2K_26095 [Kitasatospora sp. NPDC001309]|uniref:hypothetical protein n=1 Tax=Kitasatospora sp. NPDC001309 TaxID=3364013 RepID=UPI0036C417CF
MSEYGEYKDAAKKQKDAQGKHSKPGGPSGDGENTGCMVPAAGAAVAIGMVVLAARMAVARVHRR